MPSGAVSSNRAGGHGRSASLPVKRLATRHPEGRRVTDRADRALACSLAAVPSGVAALAWMAGLTPAEAGSAWRVRAVTAERQQALAALRGYPIPPGSAD